MVGMFHGLRETAFMNCFLWTTTVPIGMTGISEYALFYTMQKEPKLLSRRSGEFSRGLP